MDQDNATKRLTTLRVITVKLEPHSHGYASGEESLHFRSIESLTHTSWGMGEHCCCDKKQEDSALKAKVNVVIFRNLFSVVLCHDKYIFIMVAIIEQNGQYVFKNISLISAKLLY